MIDDTPRKTTLGCDRHYSHNIEYLSDNACKTRPACHSRTLPCQALKAPPRVHVLTQSRWGHAPCMGAQLQARPLRVNFFKTAHGGGSSSQLSPMSSVEATSKTVEGTVGVEKVGVGTAVAGAAATGAAAPASLLLIVWNICKAFWS